jgi:hypothetical protein
VFVVDPANVARFRWLRLGREWQGQIEVVDGLSAGERIVTQADATVRDGVIIEEAGHG